jgi:hypothetical protein
MVLQAKAEYCIGQRQLLNTVLALHAKLLPKSQKISYKLNAKTLVLSFTITVSHFHGTWYRGEKNPSTTSLYFFTEGYTRKNSDLNSRDTMLDKKYENLMPILYEKIIQINERSFCICIHSLFFHCFACLCGNKSTYFIYPFILIRSCDRL